MEINILLIFKQKHCTATTKSTTNQYISNKDNNIVTTNVRGKIRSLFFRLQTIQVSQIIRIPETCFMLFKYLFSYLQNDYESC